jgi:hypothetical protein
MKLIAYVILISILSGCAGVTRPSAFRDIKDRCWIVISNNGVNRAELVGEEFCVYDNVPRKYKTND